MFTNVITLGLFAVTNAIIMPNDIGKLPALGWNSWNAYGCDIDAVKILNASQQFISLGLADAGYQYVNIDDCWSVKDHRDPTTNRLIPEPTKFPNGISGVAQYIHELGLKVGIYSDTGTKTCGGYPGSLGFQDIDAATWAEWGIDYLKYDYCNIPQEWVDECNACVPENRDDLVNGTCTNTQGLCEPNYDYKRSHSFELYKNMHIALSQQSRPILFSLCNWGFAGVRTWAAEISSSWRMSGDIQPNWARILDIMNQNTFYLDSVDFWGHPDMDMLEVGNNIHGPEARTHFALWAAMKSPLLIGTDLGKISQDDLAILKNRYLLAFNQDAGFGRPARPYKWGTNPDYSFNATFPAEFWSGPSTAGTLVLIFNPFSDQRNKTVVWSEIPELKAQDHWKVTDIWSGNELGCIREGFEVPVKGHDTAGYLVNTC